MSSDEYETEDPEEGDPLWDDLRGMAEDMYKALSRLVDAIHAFEKNPRRVCSYDPAAGLKIDPKEGSDVDEVYLVPLSYYDSSALLAVEHDTRKIRFVKIYRQLVPEEDFPGQWVEMAMLAAERRAAMKAKRASEDR